MVPSRFRAQVSRVTQEPPSKFLPTASGIQQSASRRTPDVKISLHPARTAQSSGRNAVLPVREQAGRAFYNGGQPCPCPFVAAFQALVFPFGRYTSLTRIRR